MTGDIAPHRAKQLRSEPLREIERGRRRGRIGTFAAAIALTALGAGGAVAMASGADHARQVADSAGESPTSEPESGLPPVFQELVSLPGAVGGGPGDDSGELELYWWGDLGPEAQALIDRVEADGFVTEVLMVAHSPDEFRADATRLVGALLEAGLVVDGWGPNRMHDTIELMGPTISTDPKAQAQVLEIAESVLHDRWYHIAFIPHEDDPILFGG